MNLRRIYAKPGYGKTTLMIDNIVEMRQQQLTEGLLAITPTIIIAPQQYSYTLEARLANKLTTIVDIDITYFNRLAQQILQELGQMPQDILTDSSQFLLLHRAIIEVADHLSVFHAMAGQYQFTNDIKQMIKEFKQYGITPQSLADSLTQQVNERLSDLLLIYERYETLCVSRGKTQDAEDILKLAIAQIKHSDKIARSTIYITDFYNFSELEYQFIGELIKYAKEVIINLTYPVHQLHLIDGHPYQPILEQDLELPEYQLSMWRKCFEIDAKITSLVKTFNFHLITQQQTELVQEIWQVMTDESITKYLMRHDQQHYQVAVLGTEKNPYCRFDTKAIAHISTHFDKFNRQPIASHHHIAVSEHQTLADEVAEVCHRIVEKMQQDATLSWDDFAIMYRDSEQYVPILTEMAQHYQVPLDISEKNYIKNHRLIRLVFRIISIAKGDWKRENILGVFKTGLVTYSRSIIYYLLENIIATMTVDRTEKMTIKQWEPFFYHAIQQLPDTTRHNWIKTDKELAKQFATYQDDETLYTAEEFSYQLGYLLTRVYDELDELENEVIKHNIQTKAQWQQPYIFGHPQYFDDKAQQADTVEKQQSYQFLAQKAQKYEDIRQAIVQVFVNDQVVCTFEQATYLRQYLQVINDFLNVSKVDLHLMKGRETTLTAQVKAQMDINYQAWHKLMYLFEELDQILSHTPLNIDEFSELLTATLNTLTYDNIPIGQNYVLAGNFDRIQLKNKRHIYLLGLNDQVLPRALSSDSLLTEEDKVQLSDLGMNHLIKSYLLRVDEELMAYRLFTAAKDSVTVSYTLSTLAGVKQNISPYVQRLQNLFVDCVTQKTLPIISLAEPYDQDVLASAVTNYELMRAVNHYLQQIKGMTYFHRESIADDQAADYNQAQLKHAHHLLVEQQNLLFTYQQLLSTHQVYGDTIYQSLNYRHLPQALSPQIAHLLYPQQQAYSVSRLETYNQSPYLYFLKYGLRLHPRERVVLDSTRIGSLWHDVMADARIIQMINQHTSPDLVPDQVAIQTLVNQVLDEKIAQDDILQALLQERPLSYQQFIDLLTKVVVVEAYQHPFSDYERVLLDGSYSVEYAFSTTFEPDNVAGQRLKQLLDRDDIPSFTLIGIIDRIDINDKDNRLQIVDYKSGKKELKWELLAHGQQLQLVTYLWMTQFMPQLKDYQQAGMYYSHLNNKTLDAVKYSTLVEQIKHYQLEGLTVADSDQQVIGHDRSKQGFILPISTNKDGSLSKKSLNKVISSEELTQVFKLVMSSIVTTIERIYQGDITLSAIKRKKDMLTYFNDYEAICLFDEQKYPEQIITITAMKKDDILKGGMTND